MGGKAAVLFGAALASHASGFELPIVSSPLKLTYSVSSSSGSDLYDFSGQWTYYSKDDQVAIVLEPTGSHRSESAFLYDGVDTLSVLSSDKYAQLWKGFHGAAQYLLTFLPFETCGPGFLRTVSQIHPALDKRLFASAGDNYIWMSAFVLNGETDPIGPTFLPAKVRFSRLNGSNMPVVSQIEIGTFEPQLPIPLTLRYENYKLVGPNYIPQKITMEGQPGIAQRTPEPINAVVTLELASAAAGEEVSLPKIEDLVPEGWRVHYADFKTKEVAAIDFDPAKGTVKAQLATQLETVRRSNQAIAPASAPQMPWDILVAAGAAVALIVITVALLHRRRRA